MLHQRVVSTPQICAGCPVLSCGICGQVSAAGLRRLEGFARRITYGAEQEIWSAESPEPFVALLCAGHLRMAQYSVNGRRQVMAILNPGDMAGEIQSPRAGYALETVTPVTICRIERSAFQRLLTEDAELRRATYRQRIRRLDAVRRLIWSLGVQTLEERLAGFLALACKTQPFQPLPDGGGILSIQIPRGDIADHLNTSRESISRVTYRLQAAGLIEIRDATHFRIPDLDRLRRAGGVAAATEPTRRRGISLPRRARLISVLGVPGLGAGPALPAC